MKVWREICSLFKFHVGIGNVTFLCFHLGHNLRVQEECRYAVAIVPVRS
jgi:hypothetical protein